MTYDARVIEIMIASPGDVDEERLAVREVVAQWNAENSREQGLVLLPVGWETHSGSDLSGRAQALINDRLVDRADILVGIFWNRIGSSTGRAVSGSVEEVKRHHKRKGLLMLYFSDAPIAPSSIDAAQRTKLEQFREWSKTRGLISFFPSRADFRELFRRDLALLLKDNPALRNIRGIGAAQPDPGGSTSLSEDALTIIEAAINDVAGRIKVKSKGRSLTLSTSDVTLGGEEDALVSLKWRAGLEELLAKGLVKDVTNRGELFEITARSLEYIKKRVSRPEL